MCPSPGLNGLGLCGVLGEIKWIRSNRIFYSFDSSLYYFTHAPILAVSLWIIIIILTGFYFYCFRCHRMERIWRLLRAASLLMPLLQNVLSDSSDVWVENKKKIQCLVYNPAGNEKRNKKKKIVQNKCLR